MRDRQADEVGGDGPPAVSRLREWPRCLFTRLGLDSAGISGSRGFVPQTRGITATEPWQVEVGVAQGVTCGHLGVQVRLGVDGFVSVRTSPGGPPVIGDPTLVGPGHPVPPAHAGPAAATTSKKTWARR